MTVRVRFAPSPTGSLHLGNALSAAANRAFADRHGGTLVLRIDDTDPARTVRGWDEGPVRQSSRRAAHVTAAGRLLEAGAAARDQDGSVRLQGEGRPTLLRVDGSPTYQLASAVDDAELGVTHVIRGFDHRPNEPVQRAVWAGLGVDAPEVVHHGLLLGADGRKLSKRHGAASVADLRDAGLPAEAVRAYLDELDLPRHDVHLDEARLRRLSVDAIAALSDEELAERAGAPVHLARALRGARDLVEARAIAAAILEPEPARLPPEAAPTLARFVELRGGANGGLDEHGARAIVRELKAVGGDLRALRLALTGRDRGPELWTVIAALPADEALRRVDAAL